MSNASRLPVLYLAGAIRDGVKEDFAWREVFIAALEGLAVILSPLAGKAYDPTTRLWTVCGAKTSARYIVQADFRAVDLADVGVFNFLSLADGYPSVGTLIEFGRHTARSGTLRVAIWPEALEGHVNKMFPGAHPFVAENSAMVFGTVAACGDFLVRALPCLSGATPRFEGLP